MTSFVSHPKLHALLKELPLKRLTYEVSWDEPNEFIECFMSNQGRASYHMNHFLSMKDDAAKQSLQEVIEYALGASLSTILDGRTKSCGTYNHNWVEYVGFREIYQHCERCGAKKKD